ncbi:hypothetical protein BAC1_00160 [uncultured bacterium]|nr:hypothetical protein BAC1_00160 [uncultured bacterium]
MKFSERYGYKKVRELIQIESIDAPLKNKIWGVLKIFYWDTAYNSSTSGGCYLSSSANQELLSLCERIWFDFLKEPLDDLDMNWRNVLEELRINYFDDFQWYEVYDFIEFIAINYPKKDTNKRFMHYLNGVLEQEMSGYRFVDGKITRITDTEEIEVIEKAIHTRESLVGKHLWRALALLSDRSSPDYRNSVKESISAVEALVSKIVGEKGTLGQLIKNLDEHVEIHPALKNAFEKIYGYTSDASGVRHALMEQDKVDFEDAKFMLVTCSAFVNYVEGKLQA